MSDWKPPIIAQPHHVPFYKYLEDEMPILQSLNPNIENVRLLSNLVEKWEALEPIEREEYELRADAQLKQYVILINQSLSNVRRDIAKTKAMEEARKLPPIIEKKEQVQEKTRFQSPKQKNTSQGNQKKSQNSLNLDKDGSIRKPTDFLAHVGVKVKQEVDDVKIEVKRRTSKKNIPIKIEESYEVYERKRNKSTIDNLQQHPRRSQRIRSK